MRARTIFGLVGAAILLVALTTGVGMAIAAGQEKEIKRFTATADIRGSFAGLTPNQGGIRVQLFRREDQQLTPVVTVETKSGGDFLFPDVKPGEYVISPDLSSLPAGMGLTRRVLFTTVHSEPITVSFQVARIARLQVNGGPELKVSQGDVIHLETAAFDAQGAYLFARSDFSVPGGAAVIRRNENGISLRAPAPGSTLVLKASNGNSGATVQVTGQ